MGYSSSGVEVARQSNVVFVHTTACNMDWWISNTYMLPFCNKRLLRHVTPVHELLAKFTIV
jgi:hypothetical protein